MEITRVFKIFRQMLLKIALLHHNLARTLATLAVIKHLQASIKHATDVTAFFAVTPGIEPLTIIETGKAVQLRCGLNQNLINRQTDLSSSFLQAL